MNDATAAITFMAPVAHKDALFALAERRDRMASALLREALRDLLAAHGALPEEKGADA